MATILSLELIVKEILLTIHIIIDIEALSIQKEESKIRATAFPLFPLWCTISELDNI